MLPTGAILVVLAGVLISAGVVRFLRAKRARTTQKLDPLAPTPADGLLASEESWPGQDAPDPFPRHPRPSPQSPPGAASGGCTLIFSLFWSSISLAIFVVVLASFAVELRVYLLLKDSGVPTEAVVVDRRIDTDSDGADSYYVTYKYKVPAAKGDHGYLTREQSVNRDTYRLLPPESQTTVRYAPSDPSVARLESRFRAPYLLLGVTAFAGLFVAIGLFLFRSGWTTITQARALSRHGQSIQGTLLDRWTDTDSDGDRVYCVAYRFTPLYHPQVTKAEYNRAAYDALLPGDPVWVRYLPDRPNVARLEV